MLSKTGFTLEKLLYHFGWLRAAYKQRILGRTKTAELVELEYLNHYWISYLCHP